MEMMLDKKQIQAIFLFEIKMVHKPSATTCNINNAFGPGTVNDLLLAVYFLCILDYGNDVRQKANLSDFLIGI